MQLTPHVIMIMRMCSILTRAARDNSRGQVMTKYQQIQLLCVQPCYLIDHKYNISCATYYNSGLNLRRSFERPHFNRAETNINIHEYSPVLVVFVW